MRETLLTLITIPTHSHTFWYCNRRSPVHRCGGVRHGPRMPGQLLPQTYSRSRFNLSTMMFASTNTTLPPSSRRHAVFLTKTSVSLPSSARSCSMHSWSGMAASSAAPSMCTPRRMLALPSPPSPGQGYISSRKLLPTRSSPSLSRWSIVIAPTWPESRSTKLPSSGFSPR